MRTIRTFFLATAPIQSIFIIVFAAVGVFGYKMRTEGIFSCQADGYASDVYLAYCNSKGYGDYDHGAFWFDFESSAPKAASKAEVLFLGNSRMQVGFSTTATADWFSSADYRYFLLGFIHANYYFEEKLLAKLKPSAKVYIINLDSFFEATPSDVAKTVIEDVDAHNRYLKKRFWQFAHQPICHALPQACSNEYVVFRSRGTGAWQVGGGKSNIAAASDDPETDANTVAMHTVAGRKFLSQLPVKHECVIMTIVPTVGRQIHSAAAVADALGFELVAPRIEALQTFDASHLDRPSAERWSKAFFEIAGSQIRKCIGESYAVHK